MIKHKNSITAQNKTTTIFGYGLFTLLVVSFLVSIVLPLSMSLRYPTANHVNIIVLMFAFAVATILPALASYVVGDKATHAKNKALHHYNGVLFGIAAYWVAMCFSFLGANLLTGIDGLGFLAPIIFINILPVVVTIILMAIVAVTYAKKQKKKNSVVLHRPFQVVLAASVVGVILFPYFSGNIDANFLAASALMATVPIIAVGVAYRILAKYHEARFARLTDAIIAMSMGWIAIGIADSFITLLQLPYQTASVLSYVAGLVVFATYLYLRIRQ